MAIIGDLTPAEEIAVRTRANALFDSVVKPAPKKTPSARAADVVKDIGIGVGAWLGIVGLGIGLAYLASRPRR